MDFRFPLESWAVLRARCGIKKEASRMFKAHFILSHGRQNTADIAQTVSDVNLMDIPCLNTVLRRTVMLGQCWIVL